MPVTWVPVPILSGCCLCCCCCPLCPYWHELVLPQMPSLYLDTTPQCCAALPCSTVGPCALAPASTTVILCGQAAHFTVTVALLQAASAPLLFLKHVGKPFPLPCSLSYRILYQDCLGSKVLGSFRSLYYYPHTSLPLRILHSGD